MAPVTGKFIADFDSFYSAVDKAEVKLRSFEGSSATVEKQINRMADSFSGRKVISEATLMSEAIREIGGVSKLSTSEAANSLRTLEAAMDKMLRTGQEIPTSMMKTAAQLRDVGRASDLADASVGRITGTYRQFDGVLKMAGINLDAEVRALEDLNDMIQRGIPSLGAFAGAAAVAGTAFASWKIGTFVGETSGLTDAIARGTAALMGWGDVAQETAMAVADAADAIGHHEAMLKLQTKSVEDTKKATAEHTEEMRRSSMVAIANEGHFLNLRLQTEANAKAKLEDARATFAASQAQSIFGETTTKTTVAVVDQTAALEAREQSLKKIADAEAKRRSDIDAFMNASTLNDRATDAFSSEVSRFTRSELKGYGSEEQMRNRLEYLNEREGTYEPKNNKDFFQMQNELVELARLRMWAAEQGLPQFKSGVENFEGGLAKVHKDELLVNMPKGTSVIPAGQAARSSVTIHGLTIVANNRMDGERAGKAFIQFLKDSGQLMSAGVGA